ncbi:transmembrane protein, putative, partial [Bodo saltans]
MIRQKKVAIAVFLLYACFLPAGAYLAYLFLNNTELVYVAPEGSLVAQSSISAHIHFANQIGYQPMWVLVQNINTSLSIANNSDFFDYSMFLNASVFVAGGALFGMVTSVDGFYSPGNVAKHSLKTQKKHIL